MWMPRRRLAGRWRPVRVLIVEDDDAFAESLAALLGTDRRIAVCGRARDGREGVTLAGELEPDLVLMDVVLPVMDGVEATRVLGREHPNLPVVALTGLEYEERALEVREAGAVDFLRKGRLDADLTDAVVAIVRSGRSAVARRG
jgi:two-component system, NarL family, response regulator LiaR